MPPLSPAASSPSCEHTPPQCCASAPLRQHPTLQRPYFHPRAMQAQLFHAVHTLLRAAAAATTTIANAHRACLLFDSREKIATTDVCLPSATARTARHMSDVKVMGDRSSMEKTGTSSLRFTRNGMKPVKMEKHLPCIMHGMGIATSLESKLDCDKVDHRPRGSMHTTSCGMHLHRQLPLQRRLKT